MSWNIKIKLPNGIDVSGPGFSGESTYHVNDVRELIVRLETAVQILEELQKEGD